MVHYQLYGLEVVSDRVLTGLAPSDASREPDVVCRLGQLPAGFDVAELQQQKPGYSSRILDAQGVPILRIWRHCSSGDYCFQYCEGLTFLIDKASGRIWAQWIDGVSDELVTAFFLSQVLAFVLHLRGCVCFHASSVVIEGRAVLFAGNPGRGKSSTAAAFAERGCPVLADDVSALRSVPGAGLLALPGPARVCLWPDSAEFVYGPAAAEELPEFVPWENKRLVRLDRSPGKYQRSRRRSAPFICSPREATIPPPRRSNRWIMPKACLNSSSADSSAPRSIPSTAGANFCSRPRSPAPRWCAGWCRRAIRRSWASFANLWRTTSARPVSRSPDVPAEKRAGVEPAPGISRRLFPSQNIMWAWKALPNSPGS